MRRRTAIGLAWPVMVGMLFAAAALGGEEKAGAGAAAGDKAEAEAEKPKKPEKLQASFSLADGSRVTGETDLKEIPIKTVYGDLVVPVADVILLRVARTVDKETRAKVEALIKQLGAANFDDREKAYDEIYKLGPVALEQLREAVKSKDAEIRSRAEKLLAELERIPDDEEEADAPLTGDEDEVVTKSFTIRGVIKVETFEARTRYGKLEIPRDQLISASFGKPEAVTRVIKVMGHNSRRAMLATGIKLKAGDRVQVRASGSINFQNWGAASTPDGDSNQFGTFNNNIPGMGLMGRLGPNANGQMFFIGSSKTFTADSTGELFLGIGYNGSPGPTNGEYKVMVVIAPKI